MKTSLDPDWMPGDEWAGICLRVGERLFVTEWHKYECPPGFLPCPDEVEVFQVLPEGGLTSVGVLGEQGIFDARMSRNERGNLRIDVIHVATWNQIEIVEPPEIDNHE